MQHLIDGIVTYVGPYLYMISNSFSLAGELVIERQICSISPDILEIYCKDLIILFPFI